MRGWRPGDVAALLAAPGVYTVAWLAAGPWLGIPLGTLILLGIDAAVTGFTED